MLNILIIELGSVINFNWLVGPIKKVKLINRTKIFDFLKIQPTSKKKITLWVGY